MHPHITEKHLHSAYNYAEYWELIRKLIAEDKTTGDNHSEMFLHYTKLNMQRSERLDRKIELKTELKAALKSLERKLGWVALAEWWCGDVAQNLPAINKMAEASDNIELKILLRDEHPEIIEQYLTDGARSIPKLICLDAETHEELGVWGPRPAPAQALLHKHKANPDKMPKEKFYEQIQLWYARDKNETIQQEFIQMLAAWNAKEPAA